MAASTGDACQASDAATAEAGRRNSARKTVCSRRHTPTRCQRTSRRQHVLPDPQPISLESICHGIPLRNTKTIPVGALTFSSVFRAGSFSQCLVRDR
jgi:hypothetical protein